MDRVNKIKLDLHILKRNNKNEERKKDIYSNELTFTPRLFTQSYSYNRNVINVYEHLYNQETRSWKAYKDNVLYENELSKRYNELEKFLSMNRIWK